MCMEDVRIGRDTICVETTVQVQLTATPLLAASDDRYALVLSVPQGSGGLELSINPAFTIGQGLQMNAGTPPLILTIQEHGDIVRRGLYAAVLTTPVFVTIWSMILRKNGNGQK